MQKCILVRGNYTKGETRHDFTYLARELDEEALGDQDGNQQEQTASATMEMECLDTCKPGKDLAVLCMPSGA